MLIDLNSQAAWDSLYENNVDDKLVHFTRAAKLSIFGQDHFLLSRSLELIPGQRIVIIGGAFGWVAEDWIVMNNLGPIIVVDTSAWIQRNKTKEATLPILNYDVLTSVGRNKILSAIGGKVDLAISEDVLPILSDADVISLSSAMRLLTVNVAHWVSVKTPSGDTRMNWKTLEEWKTLVSPDIVIQRGTDRKL